LRPFRVAAFLVRPFWSMAFLVYGLSGFRPFRYPINTNHIRLNVGGGMLPGYCPFGSIFRRFLGQSLGIARSFIENVKRNPFPGNTLSLIYKILEALTSVLYNNKH